MLQGSQEGLELNGTQELQVFAPDVNIYGKNVNTIKRDTKTTRD
jgi:hypothetical protein